MAWIDVPGKLANYDAELYAPDNAGARLLLNYGAMSLADVAEHRRDEFEADLDYRLGACVNLRNSKAVRP